MRILLESSISCYSKLTIHNFLYDNVCPDNPVPNHYMSIIILWD